MVAFLNLIDYILLLNRRTLILSCTTLCFNHCLFDSIYWITHLLIYEHIFKQRNWLKRNTKNVTFNSALNCILENSKIKGTYHVTIYLPHTSWVPRVDPAPPSRFRSINNINITNFSSNLILAIFVEQFVHKFTIALINFTNYSSVINISIGCINSSIHKYVHIWSCATIHMFIVYPSLSWEIRHITLPVFWFKIIGNVGHYDHIIWVLASRMWCNWLK